MLPAFPALGFVVADASFKPLSVNHEAVAILTYQGRDGPTQNLEEAFKGKIQRNLTRGMDLLTALPFTSGRRTYFCRAFRLGESGRQSNAATFVIVLERGISGTHALYQVAEQFRLTRREREAVSLLLQGFSNKEMSGRMAISVNTVKALLRLVMLKMGVSSRSAIVAKVLSVILSTPTKGPSRPV